MPVRPGPSAPAAEVEAHLARWAAAVAKVDGRTDTAGKPVPTTAKELVNAVCEVALSSDDLAAVREYVGAAGPVVAPTMIEPPRDAEAETAEIDQVSTTVTRAAAEARMRAGIANVIWPEAAMPFLPLEYPVALQAMRAKLITKGIELIDAPVTGMEKGAIAGTLRAYVGGEAAGGLQGALALGRGKACERLVEQQHLRFGAERNAEIDQPLPAIGEVAAVDVEVRALVDDHMVGAAVKLDLVADPRAGPGAMFAQTAIVEHCAERRRVEQAAQLARLELSWIGRHRLYKRYERRRRCRDEVTSHAVRSLRRGARANRGLRLP